MTYIVLNAVPVFTGPAVHLNDMPLDCTQGCTQFETGQQVLAEV